MFFTCVDSRMLPTRFTQTNVGDMFIGESVSHMYILLLRTKNPIVREGGVVSDALPVPDLVHPDAVDEAALRRPSSIQLESQGRDLSELEGHAGVQPEEKAVAVGVDARHPMELDKG